MTSQEKCNYISNLIGLINRSEDFRSAESHCNYTRGVLSAWHLDLTISVEDYKNLNGKIEEAIEEKRKLPQFKEYPF